MRRTVTLAIAATALAALAAPLQAQADAWHLVRNYGHNPGACEAAGQSDVANHYAGAYDCRRTGSVAWPDFELWEA